MLTDDLEKSHQLYNKLLAITLIRDASLSVRILLGAAELNNSIGTNNTIGLNLLARFNKKKPLTETDINNTRLANEHFYLGVSQCKSARKLMNQQKIEDSSFNVREKMLLEKLQDNLTALKQQLDIYQTKMNALKAELIAKGLWHVNPNGEKKLTTIRYQQMLFYKNSTDALNHELQTYHQRALSKKTHLKPIVITPTKTTTPEYITVNLLAETKLPPILTFNYEPSAVGYLYPVTVTVNLSAQVSISAVGFIYPVIAYTPLLKEPFKYTAINSMFFSLTKPYFPVYNWRGFGITYLLSIEMAILPEQDAKNLSPGFTTNPYLFFIPQKKDNKQRRNSFSSGSLTTSPSIKTISDRTSPIPSETKHLALIKYTKF